VDRGRTTHILHVIGEQGEYCGEIAAIESVRRSVKGAGKDAAAKRRGQPRQNSDACSGDSR
jgi:hypothetical protein